MLLTKEDLEQVLQPLENNVGESLKEDAEYEKIQEEVDKINSVDAQIPNWSNVGNVARELIEKKSKDLTLASYLTISLANRDGVEGLINGLVLIERLVGMYGGELFPRRPRARLASIAWLVEQLDGLEGRSNPKFVDIEQAKRLVETIDRCFDTLREVLDYKDETSLRIVKRAREFQSKDKQRKEKNTEVEKDGNYKKIESITSEEECREAEKQCADIAFKIHEYQLGKNPKNPEPYIRLRQALWEGIKQLPVNSDGKTQLPPVMPLDRERYIGAERNEQGVAILESLQRKYPFWFDVTKKVADICAEIGGEYADITENVHFELLRLTRRVPGIENLLFSDLESFADEETKKWITEGNLSKKGSLNLRLYKIGKKWKRIEERLNDKNDSVTTEWLIEKIDQIYQKHSNNEDLYQVLNLAANILVAKGRFGLAQQCLAEMEEFVDRHRLREWNRSMVADIYRLKLEVARGLSETSEEIDLAQELKSINQKMIGVSLVDAYKVDLSK